MKKISPCYDCPDRALGCHSGCKRYIKWREEWTLMTKTINKAKNQTKTVDDYIFGAKVKNKR